MIPQQRFWLFFTKRIFYIYFVVSFILIFIVFKIHKAGTTRKYFFKIKLHLWKICIMVKTFVW